MSKKEMKKTRQKCEGRSAVVDYLIGIEKSM